jgi:hypothetical protein
MGGEIIWGLGLAYLAISKIAEHIPVSYKVKRISKSGIITHKIDNNELSYLPINECLKFGDNNDIVEDFYFTLEKQLSHCDLSSFYSNMSSLKINSDGSKFLLKILDAFCGTITGGVYFSKTNKIQIGDNTTEKKSFKKHVLTHELLHMASSRRDNDFTLSGFHIKGKNKSIGSGLNEGYTELLNGRYFGVEKSCDSYLDLQFLASGIESIIGQKEMEQAYFTNNVDFLVSELSKYSNEECAISLLVKMDNLLSIRDRNNSKRAKELNKEIRRDIVNMKLSKLKMQRDAFKISEEEYMAAVYSQELYINGYTTFASKNNDGKTVIDFIADGPLMEFGYVEMKHGDYLKHAEEYYEDFKSNGFYDEGCWSNRFGISTKKMVEARVRDKRKERFESIRSRSSIELKRMLNSSEPVKNTTVKK